MKKNQRILATLLALATLTFNAAAQKHKHAQKPAKNWQNESFDRDSVYGTGSDEALQLLKGRKPKTVIVAVIDGGVYINHPGLQGEIWVNPKETAGNKMDDDHNGYIDDVHGWDFIGGKDSDVNYDNLEITRLYRYYGKKYAGVNPANLSKDSLAEYNNYLKLKKVFETKKDITIMEYAHLKGVTDTIDLLKTALGKSDFAESDLTAYTPADSGMGKAKKKLMIDFNRFKNFMPGITADGLEKLVKTGEDQLDVSIKYQYNVDFNPRFVVGDNYLDASQRYYGNNDVAGPNALHGTHVSGIIAGVRTGKPGAQEGIADNVKIMVLRVVPNGDERDKDVANAIRYAVDNGATVINMSFGKGYSFNKQAVDAAVKYAEEHDVLLVHAAGNDHNDNDSVQDYPNRRYAGTHKQDKDWIEVGASDVHGMPASFSNYGKKTVDLFAPGADIYSTVPDSGYTYLSGTSMASPCVAGVAAIIREYFPTLSAKQVRKILMKTVTKIKVKVPMPGHYGKMVSYSDLCISGGIINATKAVKLAMRKAGKA